MISAGVVVEALVQVGGQRDGVVVEVAIDREDVHIPQAFVAPHIGWVGSYLVYACKVTFPYACKGLLCFGI